MSEAGTSVRLALPLLAAGQAQKELVHNEALLMLDLATAASAEARRDDPPASPAPGRCWLVGPAPTGAWSGRAGQLAGWTPAGWRFVDLPTGSRLSVGGEIATRIVSGWKFPLAVSVPSGGATVDAEARATLAGIIEALRIQGLVLP